MSYNVRVPQPEPSTRTRLGSSLPSECKRPLDFLQLVTASSYYNSSSVCVFLCVCGCVPYLLRGPLMDLRQTWWVYVGGISHLPLRGSFSKRSTGRRVNGSLSLSTILYRDQPHTTQLQKAPFALVPQLQSLIRSLLLLHINGICMWTSQLLLRGSFSKRSTGQRLNGSNGSKGHFHFHYIIYDSRRRQAHATLLQKAHGVS